MCTACRRRGVSADPLRAPLHAPIAGVFAGALSEARGAAARRAGGPAEATPRRGAAARRAVAMLNRLARSAVPATGGSAFGRCAAAGRGVGTGLG